MNAAKRWALALLLSHYSKGETMQAILGFLAKIFSTDAIVTRVVRTIALLYGVITALGHMPTTAQEWGAVIAAILAGMSAAGQNNSAATNPPEYTKSVNPKS